MNPTTNTEAGAVTPARISATVNLLACYSDGDLNIRDKAFVGDLLALFVTQAHTIARRAAISIERSPS